MAVMKVEMLVNVPDQAVDEIKKWEHHIDYAINFDEYPEIKSISDVKVTELDSIKLAEGEK
jgi:hypothetical protein